MNMPLSDLFPTKQQIRVINRSVQLTDNTEKAYANFIINCFNRYGGVATRCEEYLSIESAFERLREKNLDVLKNLMFNTDELVDMIRKCPSTAAMSLLLHEHYLYYTKDNGHDYGPRIFKTIVECLSTLLKKNKNDNLFLTEINNFIYAKSKDRKSCSHFSSLTSELWKVQENMIYTFFQFIINPLLKHYTYQANIDDLEGIASWMPFLHSNTSERHALVYELSKRILDPICRPISQIGMNLCQIFVRYMNYCSVTYHDSDAIHVSTNLGLFLKSLAKDTLGQLVENHIKHIKPADFQSELFENIMTNIVESCNHINVLRIINIYSQMLKQDNEYDILHQIYQRFIKPRFSKKIFIKDSYELFMNIMLFYTVGFINMDRVDDELRHIAHNYAFVLDRSSPTQSEKDYRLLMKYVAICESRYKVSTSTSRNIEKQFKNIYNYKVDYAEIQNYIKNNMFAIKLNNANQDLYNLPTKTSNRYLGLANLGNTCYMNSYVQCLYMTKKLRALLTDLGGSENSLPEALKDLFVQLSSKGYSQVSEVHPYKFRKCLPYEFATSTSQQDTAQFGRVVLDQLYKSLEGSTYFDILKDLFVSNTQTLLFCTKCPQTNKTKQQILMAFSLAWENKYEGSILITDLLRKYFTIESMDDSNTMDCERCKKRQLFNTKVVPKQFSEYLTFDLKRFNYDKQSKSLKKRFNPIAFEFELDLKQSIANISGDNTKYELYAFIVHLGSTPYSGHYKAYARNVDENPSKWYIFDDSYVSEMDVATPDDFMLGEQETPYVLFYSSQTGGRVTARNHTGIKVIK